MHRVVRAAGGGGGHVQSTLNLTIFYVCHGMSCILPRNFEKKLILTGLKVH